MDNDEVNRLKEWGKKHILEEGVDINLNVKYQESASFSQIVAEFKDLFLKKDKQVVSTECSFDEPKPFWRMDQRVKDKIFHGKKGVFEMDLFGKDKISDVEFKGFVDRGKSNSGDIIDFFPFYIKDSGVGMFFITTNGLAYILQDNVYNGSALKYGGAQAAGIVGIAVVGLTQSLWNKHKLKKNIESTVTGLNEKQIRLVERVKQYSVEVMARSYPDSMFIPYKNINEITFSRQDCHILIHFGDEHYTCDWFTPNHLDKFLSCFK